MNSAFLWADPYMDEVPPFRSLPNMLVFPNLVVLPFWFFNTGLCKKATALIAWQSTGAGASSRCGWGCTVLAVSVLLSVGAVLITAFASEYTTS